MNEFQMIKGFLNCIFCIIISCFLFFSIFEVMYMIQTQIVLWDGLIHIFIVYMIIDFMRTLNTEGHLILSTRLRRKIKVIRFVGL